MDLKNDFIFLKKPVITVVGAGGKTTVIKYLARALCAENKKTLITTTTHIMAEKEHCQSTEKEILRELEEYGLCFAGVPEGEKLTQPPLKVFRKVMSAADAVLIEGDGSKHMPIKFPSSHEPVIPPQSTDIIIVAGLSALGKKLGDVCYRYELADLAADTEVTPSLMARIINDVYDKPIRAKFPKARIHRILNQADTPQLRFMAWQIAEIAGECEIISFKEEERNDI